MINRLFRNILIYLSSILKYVNSLMHTWASYSNKEIQIHKNLIKLLLVYLLGNSTIISEEATGTFDNFRRSKVKFDLYIRLHIVFCRVIRNILNKSKIENLYFFFFHVQNLQKNYWLSLFIYLESSKNAWSKINYFSRKYLQFLTVSEKVWLFFRY